MHSPIVLTLATLAVILVVIMCIVLFAMRHANREIPGLQAWAQSYLCGVLYALNLLARPYIHEAPSIIIAQAVSFIAVWLNLAAARAYTGQPPWPSAYLAWALVTLMGLSSYLSWLQPEPEPELCLALICVVNGTLMLLSARAMFTAGIRLHPQRYLFTLACGGHGLWLLAISLTLLLGNADLTDSERVKVVMKFMVFESIIALVMRAFGVLMLANAHITAELRHFAERDPLTNVFNRRTFMLLLDKAVNLMRRMNSPLSLLLIDLDHFKRINDTWGHGRGDQALRHFIEVVTEHLRGDHVIGRIGGEEFVIFLPNTGLDAAATVAERLRALIEAQPVTGAQDPITLTVSIGVALIGRDEPQEAALHRADEAMYRAKAKGRNRVEQA